MKIYKLKDSLESKGLQVNNQKTKFMVGGSKSELPISKINPCAMNFIFCTKCKKCTHG